VADGQNGPTGREWGELTREVREIRHDLRNLKMLVDGLSLETRELEMKVGSISTKIYTTISVAAIFASVIGFVVSVVTPLVK
tara:strand:- start:2765 stop:3010 length:246 start_codon:yes stop_codon:yes gene_type:complete